MSRRCIGIHHHTGAHRFNLELGHRDQCGFCCMAGRPPRAQHSQTFRLTRARAHEHIRSILDGERARALPPSGARARMLKCHFRMLVRHHHIFQPSPRTRTWLSWRSHCRARVYKPALAFARDTRTQKSRATRARFAHSVQPAFHNSWLAGWLAAVQFADAPGGLRVTA